MIKILAVTDFHGRVPRFKKELDFDLILCAGDLCKTARIRKIVFSNWQGLLAGKRISDFLTKKQYERLIRQQAKSQDHIIRWLDSFDVPAFLVYGNGDLPREDVQKLGIDGIKPLEERIRKTKNIKLLAPGTAVFGSIQILGHSGYRDLRYKFPTQENLKKAERIVKRWEGQLKKLFSKMDKDKFTVFLSHDTPFGVLDKVRGHGPMYGKRVGDVYYSLYDKKFSPDLHVCGHMHEYQKKEKKWGTTVLNPGPAEKSHAALIRVKGKKFLVSFF